MIETVYLRDVLFIFIYHLNMKMQLLHLSKKKNKNQLRVGRLKDQEEGEPQACKPK